MSLLRHEIRVIDESQNGKHDNHDDRLDETAHHLLQQNYGDDNHYQGDDIKTV